MARDGGDAFRSGFARLAARRRRSGRAAQTVVAEAEPWPPGVEGLTFLPYLAGERTPRRPQCPSRLRPLAPPRPRCARPRRAGRGGVRAPRLPRAPALTRRGAPVGPGLGGGARSELWLKIVASVLELPLERTAAEEGAAFGAALLGGTAAVFADVHEAVAATNCGFVTSSSPSPNGFGPTLTPTGALALYPALRPLEDK